MKLGICGICGRMGIAILEVALERGHELTAAFDSPDSPCTGKDVNTLIHGNPLGINVAVINSEQVKNSDCIIDFSSPRATMKLLEEAVKNNVSLVIGTTGFSDEQKGKIEAASKKIPIVFAPNMAVGVNMLFKLTEVASKALGPDFDVEIVEAHHRFKKDAPSGTAKKLVEIVRENMEGMSDAKEVTGRTGLTGERTDREIGVMALRGGDIVGEHTVYFAGVGERVELTIRSTSRETYARGAVLAAEFAEDKEEKLYSMFDVLGL